MIWNRVMAGSTRRRWAAWLAVAGASGLLAGCSVTGQTFNTGGLNKVVVGRTTLQQAADDLGAQPVDTWQQGDGSVLARWAYTGTMATDAVYFRQEAWLLFGPDGRFVRLANGINLPLMNHPRTQEEADREAAQARARVAAAQGQPVPAASPADAAQGPIPVPAPPPLAPVSAASPATSATSATRMSGGAGGAASPAAGLATDQPLLPAGSTVQPGTHYSLSPNTPSGR
ncbi:hypothetical protein [Castellaniella caeni]|uniref:hypothetical protein n=1 Tax=Castellaniella caeni TaxID=266123 RepID=UPI000831BCFA|nr:hypothetical protein [Castellaniella caeni]